MKNRENNLTLHASSPASPASLSSTESVRSTTTESSRAAADTNRVVPGFVWHDDYALGHRTMDDTHHEFVACVHALLTVEDDALANALEAFAEHAHQHFDEEDNAMRETAYGSAGCHIDEHAAVLRSLDEVRAMLAAGQTHVVRAFARALADWFPEHVRVMDQGLARWLVQRQLGGSPVVIRRASRIAA
jgi:hemerythrin